MEIYDELKIRYDKFHNKFDENNYKLQWYKVRFEAFVNVTYVHAH